MSVVDLGKLLDQKALYEEFNLDEEDAKRVFDHLKELIAGPWKNKVATMTPRGMEMNVGALGFLCYMTGMNDGAKMIIDRNEEDVQAAELLARMDPDERKFRFEISLCPECGKPPLYLMGNLAALHELEIIKGGRVFVKTPNLELSEIDLYDEDHLFYLRCVQDHYWESSSA